MDKLTPSGKSVITKEKKKNLYEFNDSNRTQLLGIMYRDGYEIETNSYVIYKIKKEYPSENEGKTIDKNGILVNDGIFKKIDVPFEYHFNNIVKKDAFDIDEILKYLENVVLANQTIKMSKVQALAIVRFYNTYVNLNIFTNFIVNLMKYKEYFKNEISISERKLICIGDKENCIIFNGLLNDYLPEYCIMFDYENNQFVNCNKENVINKYKSYFKHRE